MKRIAILASGTGSNAKKIIEHFENHPNITVSVVITNNANAGVLNIANTYNIPTEIISKQTLNKTEELLSILQSHKIDLVVLAGFLLLIPNYLVNAYPNKIINIHPALLPKYGGKGMDGMNVHKSVKDNGEDESGISIHYVNEKYDDGDVIFQSTCKIKPTDTAEMIQKKVLKLEHKYYPKVIEELLTNS